MKNKENLKDLYPLTPMQEGMLFHSLYEETPGTYLEQISCSITGDFNVGLFEDSWNELFKWYDVFRTILVPQKAARPLQMVLKECKINFHFSDIEHLSEQQQREFLEDYQRQNRQKGFQLDRDVLMRVAVFQTQPNRYEILWTHHHILMDGWSSSLVLSQIVEVYKTLVDGGIPTPGTAPPYSYFIQWLQQQNTEAAKRYWKQYLQAYDYPVSLPRSQFLEEGYESGALTFELDEQTTNQLQQLARQSQVTLSNLIQGVWAILLAKYNDVDDVVFGSTVSGRPSDIKGVEQMIGLFINTIPVRVRVEPHLTFVELIQQIQENATASKEYSYYSLAEIQALSELKSDIINHLFVFQNYPEPDRVPETLETTKYGFSVDNINTVEQANYDFSLVVVPEKQLKFRFLYNAKAFSKTSLQRLTGYLVNIIQAVTATPSIIINDIEIFSDRESKPPISEFDQIETALKQHPEIEDAVVALNLHRHLNAFLIPSQHKDNTTENPEAQNLTPLQQTQLDYWRQQLAEIPPLLDLPTDRPRPPVQTFQGGTECFEIEQLLTQKLVTLSQKSGLTLFVTLLAAFVTVLSRYSGQEDIVVGSPISQKVELEIGEFVNILLLRSNLQGNPTFLELLSRVQQVTVDAYAHQDLPFEKLVQNLQPQPELRHSPLSQVLFLMEKQPHVTLTSFTGDRLTKFDLMLAIQETDTGLMGRLEYNTELFDAPTITQLGKHFHTILATIVAHPQAQLSQLSLLTPEERHQLLWKWNSTPTESPPLQCLHQIFASQVEQTPDAVAVVFEDQHLTYRELNIRANKIAHHLQKLGVKPEVLVGICIERSLEMVVGLLGILKAGAAYIPLDPRLPKERLAYMLSDAHVPFVISHSSSIGLLDKEQMTVIDLDTDANIIDEHSQDNPVTTTTSDNLAYVLYTSGSTGQPKGVLVTHANVVSLFSATQSWYCFSQEDVWSLFHSYAFDFSVWEMWGALLYGGRLVVVPYWTSRLPEAFYNLLCQEKVTVLNQTPSAFRQFMKVEETLDTIKNLSLRLVIFGGEALEIQSLRPWFERHGDKSPQLVNMYGITETTVHVTYRPLTMADLSRTGSLIGRPIPGRPVYILDSYQQPLPIGVKGEMYVGGSGVARGYLNRPELSDRRFIVNPFENPEKSNGNSDRLYKTGDLARYLTDGDIEYQGRMDDQVKIRGFRIELGEIEAVLGQHPAVREVVILAQEDEPDNKRLVAYVTPSHEQVPTTLELHDFLKQQLPEYMLPSAFVILDTLPLTSNGKIDRGALLSLNPSSKSSLDALMVSIRSFLRDRLDESMIPKSFQFVEQFPLTRKGKRDRKALLRAAKLVDKQQTINTSPNHPVEKTLIEIWQDVLGIKEVGIDDDFFTLGGHSLNALTLLPRIRKLLGIEIPLKSVFEFSTIRALSNYISTIKTYRDRLENEPISLLNSPQEKHIFALPTMFGYGIAFKGLAQYLTSYSVYGLDFIELKDPVVCYAKLLEQTQPKNAYIFLGYCIGGNLAFELAKELEHRGHPVSDIIMLDSAPRLCTRHESDAAIQEQVDAEIAYYSDFVKDNADLSILLNNPDFKAKLKAKTAAHIRYWNNKVNNGQIKANIHLILARENHSSVDCVDLWLKMTTGKVLRYNGSGNHGNMLVNEHLQYNALLINEILKSGG